MSLPPDMDRARFETLVRLARAEDLGEHGDLTSRLLAEDSFEASGRWNVVARREGRFCGGSLLPDLLQMLAPEIVLESQMPEGLAGCDVRPGDVVACLSGRVGQMLAAERVLLNFLQCLSGVATMTRRFVSAVAGTHAKIYDTRKTIPGFRDLQKYAVRCGGGHNHRRGLHDAILIKDNHLANIPAGRLAHAVFEMLGRIERLPSEPAFVEVECDGLDQFDELLKVVGIDVILLDNFAIPDLRTAVVRRDEAGLRGRLELEASGEAALDNVRAIAESGIDRIAVGAITHSAPILDLGLDAAT